MLIQLRNEFVDVRYLDANEAQLRESISILSAELHKIRSVQEGDFAIVSIPVEDMHMYISANYVDSNLNGKQVEVYEYEDEGTFNVCLRIPYGNLGRTKEIYPSIYPQHLNRVISPPTTKEE